MSYDLGFLTENLEYDIVYCLRRMHVIDIHAVLLGDTMSTILCLGHNRRSPKHFCKYYGRCGCQSQALRTCCDTQYSYSNIFIMLETLHPFMPQVYTSRSVNPYVANLLLPISYRFL